MILPFGGMVATLVTWNAFKSQTYRRSWQICALLLWASLLCLFAGERGTSVDEAGLVHEMGIVLPLGAFMLCVGITGVAILCILKIWRR